MTGTVCLGPMKDRAAVRGVYLYSPRDRIAETAAAYPAAFPVGVLPTKESDTGLVVRTASVAAWRADGTQLNQQSLGDPAAFNGSGYMLLGLQADTIAAKYRDDSTARGGPMMLLASPTLPPPGPEPRLHGLRGVGADPARGVAGRRARQRVTVHSGRDQRRAAVRDGLDCRHPRRGLDDQVSEPPGPTEWGVPQAGRRSLAGSASRRPAV